MPRVWTDPRSVYSCKIISVVSLTVLENYANDRMLRRVYLHFYTPYGYASISFTVWYIQRIDSDVLDPLHTCAYTGVHAGTYGQPVAAQFLRNFPPRLPKLTLTVNHSLRKVYASPNRFPIYDAKTIAVARTVIFFIFTTLLKYIFACWP